MTAAPETDGAVRVLFVCTHNAARSQMAEGLAREAGGARIVSRSAGTQRTRVHPLAVRAMDEIGVDLRDHTSKTVDELSGMGFDVVVTVCDDAARSCPEFPDCVDRRHWPLRDPSSAVGTEVERLAAFRAARDELRERIDRLLAEQRLGMPPDR